MLDMALKLGLVAAVAILLLLTFGTLPREDRNDLEGGL